MENNELEKQVLHNIIITKISFYPNHDTIKFLKAELDKMEKKAIKEGYTNLRLIIRQEPSEYELSTGDYYICLEGSRLETEEEWHKRLLHKKTRLTNDLNDAISMTSEAGLKFYGDEIKLLTEKLETSTLRCEKCGMLCAYTTTMSNWKKPRRICNICADKFRTKYY